MRARRCTRKEENRARKHAIQVTRAQMHAKEVILTSISSKLVLKKFM
jgi:hypothetical protein